MKAVILLAGVGSRLRPHTHEAPKCLLPIGRSCSLGRMLRELQRHNIHEVVFVTGYLENKVKIFVSRQFPHIKAHFVTNNPYEQTNNGYSLLLAEPYVRGETFVKLDGDISFESMVLDILMDTQDDINYLCLDSNSRDEEALKVEIDSDGTAISFGKHLDPVRAGRESIGIEKISGKSNALLFDTLQRLMDAKGQKYWQEYYEFAYDELAKQMEFTFKYVDITGLKWIEMDTPDDYALAQKYFSQDA